MRVWPVCVMLFYSRGVRCWAAAAIFKKCWRYGTGRSGRKPLSGSFTCRVARCARYRAGILLDFNLVMIKRCWPTRYRRNLPDGVLCPRQNRVAVAPVISSWRGPTRQRIITKLSQQSTITQRLTAGGGIKLPAIKRMECFDISRYTMGANGRITVCC